jgi:two-component system phosphate regulon sensor histidine kinase PhoR
MKQDYKRFIIYILIGFLTGLVFGNIYPFLLISILIFLYNHYKTLDALLYWIRRKSDNMPPDTPGVVDEITREIEYLKNRHSKRKKKLSGYLKRFQMATAALPDATVILGKDNEIEWANNKAERYLNVHWPGDMGQRIINLVRHTELGPFLEEIYKGDNEDRVLEMAAPGNSNVYLEVRVAPYGESKKLLVARDVTRLHKLIEMRKDFIANASHELRTPLTVISGYLEAFEDDDSLSELKVQLKQMRGQTDRMRRLVEDLLQLSRLETSTKISDEMDVSVPELLNGIYEEARGVIGGPQIYSLNIDAAVWIRGNHNELYSAFSNLIFNAVQYTAESGVIGIHWYKNENSICFEVTDTGEGISPEHIPRLTERFFRVDQGRSRERGGTGLGLAIVKHILAKYDAQLEIESEPGKGSLFRCKFPINKLIEKSMGKDQQISA